MFTGILSTALLAAEAPAPAAPATPAEQPHSKGSIRTAAGVSNIPGQQPRVP